MEKKSILLLLVSISLSTFAQSQDQSHTPFSINPEVYQSYDSRFMEKFNSENPSLSNRWNLDLSPTWSIELDNFETQPVVFPSNRVYPVDSYKLFIKEREKTWKMRIDPRNLNDIENRPFNGILYLPLRSFAENLN